MSTIFSKGGLHFFKLTIGGGGTIIWAQKQNPWINQKNSIAWTYDIKKLLAPTPLKHAQKSAPSPGNMLWVCQSFNNASLRDGSISYNFYLN